MGKNPPENPVASIMEMHRAYHSRSLNVLVGAGTSIAAGFPDWMELCTQILAETAPRLAAGESPAAFATEIINELGREAALDVARESLDESPFLRCLASALYRGRKMADLPVLRVHRQLASLACKAKLFTTNFDPLLELAF